jgi:PIN domain nuclease of toxin-antitoxin system
MGIRELAVGGEVALRAAALAPVLVDPADCFVAATASMHGATLVTADRRLLESRAAEVLDARR